MSRVGNVHPKAKEVTRLRELRLESYKAEGDTRLRGVPEDI